MTMELNTPEATVPAPGTPAVAPAHGAASMREYKGEGKPFVTFVRGPIVATDRAFNNEATPWIAQAYLSAYIAAHGYAFETVDGIAEDLNRVHPLEDYPGFRIQGLRLEEIVERIPAKTDVLALSTMFSGEWPVLRKLIQMLRQRFPDALILAGGEHITALSEYSLRDCPELDLCVRGEGEHILYEVLECFGDGGDFASLGGISYLDADGTYVEQGGLPRIREINEIPWPLWPEGYLDKFWKAGKSYGIQTERDMPIMASRGCPYQCTFCSNPAMWTTRYILRDVDDLVAEIKDYIARYKITSLQFYDLTAITKKRWTVEFCNRLLEEGIDVAWSLPSGTRSEALDQETLSLLKQTNCNYLAYAPESGSPDTLQKIKKRITLESLSESVFEAGRQGITVRTNLIIGFPHETRRHVFETIRYGLYLAWRGADEVSINIFSPYPGTEIFDELMASGRLEINDHYFLSLSSLNSDYTNFSPLICNANMGIRELAIYRIGFMLMNYGIGYLRYPSRIIRTLRNIFGKDSRATTVIEHRLKDTFERRRATEGSKS